jgi:Dyp-type peroxidase family
MPPTASTVSTTTSTDPVLAIDEIQGDVLLGLQKQAQAFIFFSIFNVGNFKKRFTTFVLKRVTNTRQAQTIEKLLAANKALHGPLIKEVRGLNVGFTNSGIAKLAGSNAGKDASFLAGAPARAAAGPQPDGFPPINDPRDANGKLTTWLPQFADGNIDGIIFITGASESSVDAEADTVVADLTDSIAVVYRENGKVRPGLFRGHEHFGYQDGVSQPGVRGLTERQNPNNPNQGLPGQDLIWPGEFVFGYPAQDPKDPIAPAAPKPFPFPWMENGSYMVFRRLAQLVPEFHAFSLAQGKALGIDPTLLEARLVGRWKSGAPLPLTPIQDDIELAGKATENNNFDYSLDPQQRTCPYAAHIRKTNPREDAPAQIGGKAGIQTHRIMRAGIPFGPEVDPAEAAAGMTTAGKGRGLMFVCYQTSIVNQFEFVQRAWVNNPGFVPFKTRPDGTPLEPPSAPPKPDPQNPFPGPGWDALIGQSEPPGGDRSRILDEPLPNYPSGNVRSTLKMPNDFIVPTGGAYFFVPSIKALQTVLLA